VGALAVGPDGKWLASASDDATIRVWDAVAGRQTAALDVDGPLYSCAWHPTRRVLAVGGARGLYVLEYLEATARLATGRS
jgi:WD40 repeat protein